MTQIPERPRTTDTAAILLRTNKLLEGALAQLTALANRPVSSFAVSLGIENPQTISMTTTSANVELVNKTQGRGRSRLYTLTADVNCYWAAGAADVEAVSDKSQYLPAGLMIVVRLPERVSHLAAVVSSSTGTFFISEAVSQDEEELNNSNSFVPPLR